MIHSLLCYAKINLFLEVLEIRPDGYHEIFSLYQAVDTADTLEAQPALGIELTGADAITRNIKDNLIYKAADIMHKKFSPGKGIHFHLKKILPSGAGLGGGSSNCAAAIKLCNLVWELNLSVEEMVELGSELGSDVPFFIDQHTAFATGTGTHLETAPPPRPYHVLIATPAESVKTARAYSLLNSRKTVAIHSRQQYLGGRFEPSYYQGLINDFESVILQEFPKIKALKKEIEAYSPQKTMLSGSGSSIFALFDELDLAQKCAEKISSLTIFQTLTRFMEK